MPRLQVVRDPSLDDPVATLPGVSDKTEAKLGRLGIATIRDLLLFFPRRQLDLHLTSAFDSRHLQANHITRMQRN